MQTLFPYLSSLDALQLTGVAGFLVYIGIFGAVQFEFMNGNSAYYTLGNITAATLVAVSLIADFNLASALIQGSWIIIGLTGLIIRFRKAARSCPDAFECAMPAGAQQ